MANKGFTYVDGQLVEIPMSAEEEAEFLATQNIVTLDSYKADVEAIVDNMLLNLVKSYGYKNVEEVGTYTGYDNVFRYEAELLGAYISNIWQITLEYFNTVSLQSVNENFVSTLPVFEFIGPPTVGVLNVTTFQNGERSFSTAYKISETSAANISVSVSISCVLSVTGGQSAKVELQISPDGTNWTSKAECKNTSTGTIQVGTQTTNITQTLQTDIPRNWYWRLKKTNLLSSPSCAIEGGTETIYNK